MNEEQKLEGPKPIAVAISTDDIRMLFATQTNPDEFLQLILAKLKDAGAPVEGALRLRLAHGQVYKMRTDPMKPQDAFEYVWLPEIYVASLQSMRASGPPMMMGQA
jgi:hypothetical protein